jgi:hypothetical protein
VHAIKRACVKRGPQRQQQKQPVPSRNTPKKPQRQPEEEPVTQQQNTQQVQQQNNDATYTVDYWRNNGKKGYGSQWQDKYGSLYGWQPWLMFPSSWRPYYVQVGDDRIFNTMLTSKQKNEYESLPVLPTFSEQKLDLEDLEVSPNRSVGQQQLGKQLFKKLQDELNSLRADYKDDRTRWEIIPNLDYMEFDWVLKARPERTTRQMNTLREEEDY